MVWLNRRTVSPTLMFGFENVMLERRSLSIKAALVVEKQLRGSEVSGAVLCS